MSKVSHNKNALPSRGEWLNLLHRLHPNGDAQPAVDAPRNLSAGGGGGVPVAPGVVYNPVDAFDRSLVESSPVARHMLAASTATQDYLAAAAFAAQGNFAGAALETQAMWNAWAGVAAPF